MKSMKTIVRGGVMKLGGRMPVLLPSQVGWLITSSPKKLHRNPKTHNGIKNVLELFWQLVAYCVT